MSFEKRKLVLTFKLGQGDFGTTGQDTITLEGLRCSTTVTRAGVGYSAAEIQVWGMSLDLMNRLTVTRQFYVEQRIQNQVIISAGTEGGGVGIVFAGTIWSAWVDARQQPDVCFVVTANSGAFDLATEVPPTSYKGSVDAALVIGNLAAQMGYSFENNGVSATLTDPYKPGSIKSQIESVCKDIDCEADIDEVRKVVAIWPRRGSRTSKPVVKVSPETGLVGYPAFSQAGIMLTTRFNPDLAFGTRLQVECALPAANGIWPIIGLQHRLESNVPNGQWFSDVQCIYSEAQQ